MVLLEGVTKKYYPPLFFFKNPAKSRVLGIERGKGGKKGKNFKQKKFFKKIKVKKLPPLPPQTLFIYIIYNKYFYLFIYLFIN